jgi:hypothetical protein
MIDNHVIDNEEEWKTMKANWQATSVAEMLMTQRLRWSLRLRMLGSWCYLGLEIAAFVMLVVLAAIQAAMGQAGAGAVYLGLALICAAASFWARRKTLRGARGSLLELVDASLRHARRGVRMAWANYFMTLATAAAILVLYFSDIGDRDAAYHDDGRVVAAMLTLVIYAVGVGVYHWFARRRVRRFSEMSAQMTPRSDE